MAPLIMAGLSLLPKLPELWNGVAGLFGKKVPDSAETATNLAGEVINSLTKGNVSEETQKTLKAMMYAHEERIQELALEEQKLHFKNMSDQVDLEKASYQSEDQYVRRTRPMILRKLFYLCSAYAIGVPYCMLMTISLGGNAVSPEVIGIIEWIGGWLFGTFSTAYLGYSAARSVVKKNPDFKNGQGIFNKVVKQIV